MPLLLGTIRQHSAYDEIIELGLECLLNVSSVGVQNSMVLLLEGAIEMFHSPPLRQASRALLRHLQQSLGTGEKLLLPEPKP